MHDPGIQQEPSHFEEAHVTQHLLRLFPESAGVSPAPEAAKIAALPGGCAAEISHCGGWHTWLAQR